MIYLFRILSNEVDDFVREIQIDGKDNFARLHKAIQAACVYDESQITSFFMCNEDWEKEQEITLMNMSEGEDETLPMDETIIQEVIKDKKQKLLYLFDFFADRALFLEVTEIWEDKSLNVPLLTFKEGEAPESTLTLADLKKISDPTSDSSGSEHDLSAFGDFDDGFDDDIDAMDSGSYESLDDLDPNYF